MLESKVYPRIQSGNAVKMEIAVSEDKAVRSKMEKRERKNASLKRERMFRLILSVPISRDIRGLMKR